MYNGWSNIQWYTFMYKRIYIYIYFYIDNDLS